MRNLYQSLCAALVLSALTPSLESRAQDTTWVQTYTYDSLWTRRAKFFFPTANEQYRKVLMYFTIKCYPTLSGDGNYACGEWDYIYFNNIYDHRGVLDSTAKAGRYFKLYNGSSPDSLRYAINPQFDLYKSWIYNTVPTNTATSNYTVGAATVAQPHPFNLAAGKERAQFVWKASELQTAGLTAGNITGIKLNFQGSNATLNNLQIRIKQVPYDNFDVAAMEVDTLTRVYNYNRVITTAGLNNFQFNTPFNWNGTSHLLIDFSFDNNSTATANQLLGENTSYTSGLYSTTGNYALSTSQAQGGNVRFPASVNMFSGNAPRTYEIWMNVDSFISPEGTLFSAGRRGSNSADFTMRTTSPNNNYRLNLWSSANSQEPIFSGPNTKNSWKQMTVTYATDTFRFYMNGKLVYTKRRTGVNTQPNGGEFFIGESREGGYNYLGKLSHLRIWDKKLSETDIKEWVGKDITATHPDFAHLKADYRINTGIGSVVTDASANAQASGNINNNLWWQKIKPRDYYYNVQKLSWRPQIQFERNTYTSTTDSVLVTDTVYKAPTTVYIYGNPGANQIISDNSPVNPGISTDTLNVWTQKYRYTYTNGVKTDSTLNVLDSVIYNHNINWYSNTVQYEIGRSISPYGINLDLGTGRTRIYDVTDYYPLLQDTVDLEVGSTQELQNVRFAFIKGEPAAEVNHIAQPWPQSGYKSYKYGAIVSDTVLSPKNITLKAGTDQVKFRSYVSGHGGAENAGPAYPNGCCEFMYNNHYYKSNGQTIKTFRIERTDCSVNPIFPQGGTWVYRREGWCPGDIIESHDMNVSQYISGGQINLDYQIAAAPAGNEATYNGNYNVGLQLIEYKTPGRNNDAEIYTVRKPSDDFVLSRMNPICVNPQVVIRNAGKNNLTSAVIKYKVSGGQEASYNWNGNLKFLDTAIVDLPVNTSSFWVGDNTNRFLAWISGANNTTDEYAGNDTGISKYNLPDVLPTQKVVFKLKTNSSPQENTLTIRNMAGTVVLSKTGMTANTTYNDTLNLPFDCYTLTLDDNGAGGVGDGLQWWANTAQGSGTFAILNGNNGQTLKTFQPDFGAQVFYTFTVGWPLKLNDKDLSKHVSVYPNPNNGNFTVSAAGFSGTVSLELTNSLGQVVLKDAFDCYGGTAEHNINAQGLAAGVYMLRMNSDNSQAVQKIIIK
ncbi:LamG-like jellyroll fold domain-containing protein [Edaphocola aurantiacus]|uniref:LamG-like jellyroll fold domain-containing protein n=1 Tax=Edaphocola aurantiacus TaxID=2601682 RepID=UPI001C98ACB1|nr:LamG-like jellyroll fold domain-containing protein [Edaphocola aurantiacus]